MGKSNGSCLCGGISYDCNDRPLPMAMCHSPRCHKRTGVSLQQLRLAR
jgi:hypothetical protein